MKKVLSCILCLLLFTYPFAFATPLANSAKPAGMWSVSDCKSLVGEDVFNAMVTEAKQNIFNEMKKKLDIGFAYSPYFYATMDSLRAEGLDPDEVIGRLGDSSSGMIGTFTALKQMGYISKIPSTYNEEVEAAIKKIQYAVGLPVTGELTLAIVRGLQDSVIYNNKLTLEAIISSSQVLQDKCEKEMELALSCNEDLLQYSYNKIDSDLIAHIEGVAFSINAYDQALTYIPSYVAPYSIYMPLTSSYTKVYNTTEDEEAYNISANTSALLSVIFMCAQYEFANDISEYAAEYYDLNK